MKFLDRILTDIKCGQNIDLYVTALVAIIIVTLILLGVVSQQLVSSLTLAVLALMTINLLVNRHSVETITEQLIKNNKNELTEKFPFDFTKRIETAKELWLTGMHHSSAMSEYYESFEKMLKNGGTLKVMVADPEGAACAMTAMRFAGNVEPEQERTRTRANIRILEQLARIAPGRVEIRIIDYLFEYNAFLIDPNFSDGIIYLQRYTFKVMGGARKPKLVYRPGDGGWYDLIRFEVLAIWECGRCWTTN